MVVLFFQGSNNLTTTTTPLAIHESKRLFTRPHSVLLKRHCKNQAVLRHVHSLTVKGQHPQEAHLWYLITAHHDVVSVWPEHQPSSFGRAAQEVQCSPTFTLHVWEKTHQVEANIYEALKSTSGATRDMIRCMNSMVHSTLHSKHPRNEMKLQIDQHGNRSAGAISMAHFVGQGGKSQRSSSLQTWIWTFIEWLGLV